MGPSGRTITSLTATSARWIARTCTSSCDQWTLSYQSAGPSTVPLHTNLKARRSAHSSARSGASSLAFPTHTSSPTPYEIFHFTSRAVSQSEIKARYYDLVRNLHPDRVVAGSHAAAQEAGLRVKSNREGKERDTPKSLAEEQFKLVVDAYNLLKDPHKKNVYDRSGFGWTQTGLASETPSADSIRRSRTRTAWQDNRYTSRSGGHDRYGWQNHDFYSNHYNGPRGWSANAGWKGGNGQYASNGMFISSLFLITWVLAGYQYNRLSLQSQKVTDRADKTHLDAAQSLQDARKLARSEQGRARLQAFRRRAREQRTLEELDHIHLHSHYDNQHAQPKHADHSETLLLPPPPTTDTSSRYGIGHGGPSGKQAAHDRFYAAQRNS